MEDLTELLQAPARQARSVASVDHRPWPIPREPWVMGQTWDDLLFAHWRVDAEALRPLVSPRVEVKEHDGSAWLGVTPFRVVALRLRGLLPLPRLSQFLELNVRTYVSDGEKPGIWFFSLDAASRLAVEAARAGYKLPYFHARISSARSEGWIRYELARIGAPGTVFSARYRGVGDAFTAAPGTLEHFLTERYCLYTEHRGRLKRADIHHGPWPLERGEADIELNTMSPVELPDEAPHLMFSPRQDVALWRLADLKSGPR